MARRMNAEEKIAGKFIEGVGSLGFRPETFVTYLSMAPLVVKERVLDILYAFVVYEKEKWDEERFTPEDEDYYRDCTRMADVMRLYR